MMKIDLIGRVRNTRLPKTKPLLPLFEAVVNSIHAIEEADISDGNIEIRIERDESQSLLIDSRESFPINGFRIIDNGVGFNKKHLQSFQTSDTTVKMEKGSKGIGRFLWLKAFNLIHVESITYDEDPSSFYSVKFDFELSEEGIKNILQSSVDSFSRRTTIHLSGFHKDFRSHTPQKCLTISKRILEHCLVYFMSEKCPKITVIDTEDMISLNELFEQTIKVNSTSDTFTLKSQEFKLSSIRLFSADDPEHKVHYCANNREVLSEKISKYIPSLNSRIEDNEGNPFTYLAYISGKYLDENVNPERTDFTLISSSEIAFTDEITKAELVNETILKVKQELSPLLININQTKNEKIEEFVYEKAPQYRPLLKHKPEYLEKIPPGLSDEKLDLELYKLNSEVEVQLKEQSHQILNIGLSNADNYNAYRANYRRFIEEFNDFGKSKLSQYIIHRKAILDIFTNNLGLSVDEDRYKLERDLHEIIFPLRTSSDDIDFSQQNLWIIDEKLSYHKYLASDLPFNQMTDLSVDGGDRPDVIIFNNRFAFVQDETPYSSVVIIEFKRPMRTGYSDDDNPITQVQGYVRQVKEGRKLDKQRRPISISPQTPFYCYIICDLTPKIREFSENQDYTISPDHLGYFGYNRSLTAYIEIISFDKLVADARKRNAVLFDKLHLPRS